MKYTNGKDINSRLDQLESRIEEIKKTISELEASEIVKQLKSLSAELESINQERNNLYSDLARFPEERMKRRIAQRDIAIKKYIERIKQLKTIKDETGKEIPVPEEIKISLIEELRKFMEEGLLSHTLSYEETDNYSIKEEILFNNEDEIEIRVITNDFPIAAKSHAHFKTIDEVLLRYMNFIKNKSTSSPKNTLE